MACARPVPFRGGALLPCYRCAACRQARGADLVTRLLVETLGHLVACLVTLTYRNDCLPEGRSLKRADVRAFLKRLRRAVEYNGGGVGLRLFVVAEYGTKSGRPHYHLIVWGLDASTVFPSGRCFPDLVNAAWGMGTVDVGKYWSAKAAGYVAGYVSKGLNVKGLDVLRGRSPEFSIFPNRPGLGGSGVSQLVKLLIGERDPLAVIEAERGLPRSIDLGGTVRLLRGRFYDQVMIAAGLDHWSLAHHRATWREQSSVEDREQLLDELVGSYQAAGDFPSAAEAGDRLDALRAADWPAYADVRARRLKYFQRNRQRAKAQSL